MAATLQDIKILEFATGDAIQNEINAQAINGYLLVQNGGPRMVLTSADVEKWTATVIKFIDPV